MAYKTLASNAASVVMVRLLQGRQRKLFAGLRAGPDDVFRIRVDVYRIIYSVSGRKLVIVILKIGHRKDIYR